jgi:putative ABC transport system permease protein
VARVPLARRNLAAEKRRVAVSLLGIGGCIALILLLQGLWNGTRAQISAYPDNSRAELFVGATGARNLASDGSTLPAELADEIGSLDRVSDASPIGARFVILDLHTTKIPLTVVGSEPHGMGGPWNLGSGRAPRAPTEIALDEVTAADHGLGLGDELEFMGQHLEVVGLLKDSRSWMTGMAFVTLDALQAMQRTPGGATFILVDTPSPAAVSDEIDSRYDVEVLTAQELADNERRLYADIIESPLLLMIGIAFAAGTMIVALTAYSSLVERLREFGVARAIGARDRDLLRTVLGETLLLAIGGTAVGFALFGAASLLLGMVKPQFWTVISPRTVVAVGGSALLMAALATYVPVRRVSRVEPASVYRS